MNPLRRVPALRALDGEPRPIDRVRQTGQLNLNLLLLDDGNVEESAPSLASCLSPLDRLRTGRQRRARELGCSLPTSPSHGNQSVPAAVCQARRSLHENFRQHSVRTVPLAVGQDRLQGDGMSTCSYHNGSAQSISLHQWPRLGASFESNTAMNLFPSAQTNPSTAIFTLDMNTNKILMVNARACNLLEYTSEEFSIMTFAELIQDDKHRAKVLALKDNLDGSSSMCNGKMMEFRSKSDNIIPVFMWLKPLEGDGRCLAMAEPVQRRIAKIVMDSSGHITHADSESCLLFQCEEGDMKGRNLCDLIPSFSGNETKVDLDALQDSLLKKKKMRSGLTVESRQSFPLILRVIKNDDSTYTAVIWVFENLSGLIIIDVKGHIVSCNNHFTRMMFGYTKTELIGQSITKIIPDFCENMGFCDGSISTLPTSERSVYESAAGSELDIEARISPDIDQSSSVASDCYGSMDQVFSKCDIRVENRIRPPVSLDLERPARGGDEDTPTVSPQNRDGSSEPADARPVDTDDEGDVVVTSPPWIPAPDTSSPLSDEIDDFVSADDTDDGISLDGEENDRTPVAVVTSTPCRKPRSAAKRPVEDSPDSKRAVLAGSGTHKDGLKLDISYRVRMVPPMNGSVQYLVLVSLDVIDKPCSKDLETAMSSSVGGSVRSDSESSALVSDRADSLISVPDEQLSSGPYGESFTNLKQIGKGAHGFVYLAYQHSDQRLVVTKFISKLNTLPSAFTEDINLKKILLEIEILTKLQHVNIVKVLQVYENPQFYIIVMEKHGPGMDLFEFIDRRPKLDEALISYIFRQIVFALDYLHSRSILHRDIKDENVIIDQHFNVKLIDFGSATYLEEGNLFSTFYGTVEYCSPEVLAGNKYAGPELEMWALGVTLYIMVFGQNPFFNVEATLKGEFRPPKPISDELMLLLKVMLAKDVSKRCQVEYLAKHSWINQRVDISKYSFSDVVTCTSYEANPPVFYSEYCPDVTNSSLSLHEELDCSAGNSLGSLTTVENFDSEEVRQSAEQETRPSASMENQTATDIPLDDTSNYDDDDFPELSDDSDESYKDPENLS